MSKYDEKTKTWVGETPPDLKRVWDKETGLWRSVEEDEKPKKKKK